MELGDGKFAPPYPPPPEEPIRIFCPHHIEWIRREWQRITYMPNIEWSEDWSKCKLMIFVCPPEHPGKIYPWLRDYLENFFKRDGRESLVYEYDRNHRRFIDWDFDIFRRDPWRVMDAS